MNLNSKYMALFFVEVKNGAWAYIIALSREIEFLIKWNLSVW